MTVQDTDNTGADDSVDTSTNEEALDTEDTSLEDSEISFDDAGDDDTEEADDSDSKEDSASTDDEDTEEKSEEDDADESSEDDDKDTTDAAAEVDKKEQARQAYEARQAEKAERAKVEAAKKDAQRKYIDDAADEQDRVVRELKVEAYNNRIKNNTRDIESAVRSAYAGIDLFRTGTPAVQERLGRALDQWEAQHIRKDANGDPLEVDEGLVEFLQEEAESIKRIMGDGAVRQNKDKSGQTARTMTPPSKAPKKAKVDPDLEAFDAVAKLP